MATVNKNFKIKQGLVVEGSTATVGGNNVLVETASDQYIIDLIGGETLVTSVESTQMEVISGELNIKSGVFDVSGAAAAAQSAATSAAATDATSKANAAQAAAEATASADATSKANAAKTAAEATASADATSKANAAQAAAISAAASDATTKANAAQAAAISASASAISTAIATEVTDRNTAIGTAVSNLVDGAPALLNTLDELAAALADSPDTVSNLSTLVGTKAPLASPALTGVPTAPTAAANTDTTQIATTAFAKAEADAAQTAAEATASADATSKANAAVSTASADATSKANAAQAAAIAHADALTTSDVAEGTSQYFTDARSKASAADLLTGATKTNITITGSGSGLVITAENGVADSTTTDLAEGTNLYFTNARAISATAASYDVLGAAAAAKTAAEATASADATDKVAAEAALRSAADIAALAAAASDATTKANAAQSAAEATASADATSKANAAKSGAEATAAAALTTHSDLTVAHGATGAVVGTTNTQTLTNKTIGDTLNFTGAGAMTINSDSHIVLTPAAGSSVKWGADVLATQGYADQAESDAIGTASADATSKANAALADAEYYTDGKIATEVTDRNSAITSAIGTEVTDRNSAIATAKSQAIADANAYTDGEVAALVSTAPELLDTLAELATAIAANPNYATDAAAAVAGRVAKSGDTMTGDLTLPGAPTLNLHAATKAYVDAAQAAAESAGAAEATAALGAANLYTDGRETAITTAYQNYANTAESDAVTTANSYTDGRETAITTAYQTYADQAETDAKAYTDTREGLITTAYQTYADQAETDAKAYADALTTADVAEVTNLYFTAARAVTALQNVTPNFTEVEVNSVAKQVAATSSAPTAGVQMAYAWPKSAYRSAEFLVKVGAGGNTEVSKVLLTLDTADNIAITEYGIVATNVSLAGVSAVISGSNVELRVTTLNNTSVITVVGTLLV
jgi:hypothetical protein